VEIAAGYLSPYFITDLARREAKLEEPCFLIVQGKLASARQMLRILEQVANSGRSLLVVAEEVEGEALATLIVNKIRGSLSCCAVKAAGTKEERDAVIRDLVTVTGAKMVLDEDVASLALDDLGGADRVVVTVNRTQVLGAARLN
jgi:chaperonin GroEL